MSPRPEPKSLAMPMDRAILWNPPAAPGATSPGKASTRTPYPIFFQQEAVIALQDHLKNSPTQAIFGFLIGDLYRDPDAGVLYTIIDKTLKLSQPIYGDKTDVVVSRLWDRMQEQLSKVSASLLGWYHSHPGQGGFLTPHDVETHDKFFTDPWHVAVLLAAEAGGLTGRFFRAGQGNTEWHKTPLPFYELLQPDSIKPDGKKRSFITWRNYKPYGPTLTAPKSKAAEEPVEEEAEAPPAMPVIKTSADDEPAPAPKPVPPPPPPPPKPPEKTKDIPWQVSPQEVSAAPMPLMPTSAPPPVSSRSSSPPAPARRSSGTTFRLLEEDTARGKKKPAPPPKPTRHKQRSARAGGSWLKRIAVLFLLAGAGAGGYWYFAIRDPGMLPRLFDQGKQLVSRLASGEATPPPTAGPRRRQAPSSQGATSAAAVQQPVAAPPPVSASPFARFDRLSDSLTRAVRSFQDRARLFARGQMGCGGLATGLIAVDNLWITYNAERKARLASFDPARVARDQSLWAAVDSVSRRFDSSGCPRP